MPKTMIILRGLPGAGKTTYCRGRWPHLTPMDHAPQGWHTVSVSADDYFTTAAGEYLYNPALKGPAHAHALCNLIEAIKWGAETIVVDNTHVQTWEFKVATRLGQATGYTVEVVDLFDGGQTDEELAVRNTHSVPVEQIKYMRGQWQPA